MKTNQDRQTPSGEDHANPEDKQALLYWSLLKENHHHALEWLYKSYSRVLHNYGYRIITDKELVKDAVQDLFVQIWNNANKLPAVSSVKAYLLVALRRELLRRITKQRQFVQHDFDLPEESFEEQMVELQKEEMISKGLSGFIQKLPTRQREIIFLKYYSGLSTEEIASTMGLTPGSVYKLIYKALASLKELTYDWKVILAILLIARHLLLLEVDIG